MAASGGPPVASIRPRPSRRWRSTSPTASSNASPICSTEVIDMAQEKLSAEHIRDLRALAGMIIPASAAYDVPGADDEKIFNDILRSFERDRDDIGRALAQLSTLSGGAFAD